MHPLVRDLYKRVLIVGRDYPLGLQYVKNKAKVQFQTNSTLFEENSPTDFMKAIHSGRWQVKEMIGIIQLKKYRTMKERY